MIFETTRNASEKEDKLKVIIRVNLDTNFVTFSRDFWSNEGITRLSHSVITDGKVYLANSEDGLIRKGKATNLVTKLKKAYPDNNRFSLVAIEELVPNPEVLEGNDTHILHKYYEVTPLGFVAQREFTDEQLEELKERGKRLSEIRHQKELA